MNSQRLVRGWIASRQSRESRPPLPFAFPIPRSFRLSLSDRGRSVANDCSSSFSLSVRDVYILFFCSPSRSLLRCSLAGLRGSRQGRREPRRHVLCPPGSLSPFLSPDHSTMRCTRIHAHWLERTAARRKTHLIHRARIEVVQCKTSSVSQLCT